MIRNLRQLALGLSLTACAPDARLGVTTTGSAPVNTPAAPSDPDDGSGTVELQLDPPATRDGLELTWTALADSRCPEGVNCVWAGEATVQLRARDAGDKREVTLKLGPGDGGVPVETERHRIRLTGVTPYPREGVAVAREAQRATIAIERR
jgi:hypothetical protein